MHGIRAVVTGPAGHATLVSNAFVMAVGTLAPAASRVTAATTATVSGMVEAACQIRIVEGGLEVGSTTSNAAAL